MLSCYKEAGIMHIAVYKSEYRLALKNPKKKKEVYSGTVFKLT